MKPLLWIELKTVKNVLFLIFGIGFGIVTILQTWLSPTPVPPWTTPVATYRIETPQRHVALTVTLASPEDRAQQLFDWIHRQRIETITWLITRQWAENNPQAITILKKRKAEIGASISLPKDEQDYTDGQLRHQLRNEVLQIEKLIGQRIHFIEFTGGPASLRVLRIAQYIKLPVIASSHAIDLSFPMTKEEIEQQKQLLVRSIRPGDIISLPTITLRHHHAWDSQVREDILNALDIPTISLLSTLLPILRMRGYTIKTVSDLIGHAYVEEQPTTEQSS